MRGALAGLSLLLLAAEHMTRFCTILHYFLTGQYLWCWITLALLLPGYLVQVLSLHWFRADGNKLCWTLVTVHLLQLGLWKRYWDVLWSSFKAGKCSHTTERPMKQGDLGVLRLLEALLQTLPVLLLQAYACVVMEAGGLVSGLSAGMSLLSLSWALVSYSHSMCLIKLCHLPMPGTALLCQLLWRTGMVGSRVMTLVLFARIYHLWVFAAAGIHWLVMSYWTVAQQTDIFQNSCHWKLFNLFTGAVYIFCYISFKDGPSFCRMAVYYIIMLSENVCLLLMSMDFLHGNSQSNLWILGAVTSGSILGFMAMVTYYSLLHPKSTEIWQRFLKRSHSLLSKSSKGNTNLTMRSTGISGLQGIETSSAEPAMPPLEMPNNSSLVELDSSADGKDLCENSHHWLLIKLALKTGSISKIKAAFGKSDSREFDLVPMVKNCASIVKLGPKRKLSFITEEKFPISQKSKTGEQRFAEENKVTEDLSENKEHFYLTSPASKHTPAEDIPAEFILATNPIHQTPTAEASTSSTRDCCSGNLGVTPVAVSHESSFPTGKVPQEPTYSCSTVYFTVREEGAASPGTEGKTMAVNIRNLAEPAKSLWGTSMPQSGGNRALFTSAEVSPIAPISNGGYRQNSPDFSTPVSPKLSGQQETLKVQCNSSHAYLYKTWASLLKEQRRTAEERCLTSTPKSSSTSNGH